MLGLSAAKEGIILVSTRAHPILEDLKTKKEAGQDGLPEKREKRSPENKTHPQPPRGLQPRFEGETKHNSVLTVLSN